MKVKINDETVSVRAGSLRVSDAINERSTARFLVQSIPGGTHYQKGEPVAVYNADGDRVFAGLIEIIREVRIAPDGALGHEITAVDWHYLADKRLIAEAYEDTTPGDIVADIVDNYLEDEGVTIDDSVDNGSEITEAVFNYIPIDRALDVLAEKTNMWWYIDFDRVLHFVERDHYKGPELTGGDMLDGSVEVERSNTQYRNRQWVRGGIDKTEQQVETKRGDGDSRDFAVGFRVYEEPTIEVKRKEDAWQTQDVGKKGEDEDADWYWEKFSETVTQDREGEVLASEDRVRITYRGVVDVIVRSDDHDQIRRRKHLEGVGTGITEQVDDDPELNSRNAAFELAASKLEKYARVDRKLTFETRCTGLMPGQLVTVTLPEHDLDGAELLVESLEVRDEQGMELRTRVRALEGPAYDSWAKFFGYIATRGDTFIVRENIGEDEILVLLLQFEKEWGIDENPNIMREVFPADDVYPSESLYPMFDYDHRITHIEWVVDGEVAGRKRMTTRENMDTAEIYTMVYLTPFEALGNVEQLHWYGGINAADEQGTGIKVATETHEQEKTSLESWQIERIDRKGWL